MPKHAADPAMDIESRRAQLYALLGDLPPRDRPISARLISAGEHDGYWLEQLELDLNGSELVPAYFLRPLYATGVVPTVLYNHCHGGRYEIGKSEILKGHPGVLLDESYGRALTQAGYAVLCIDAWCFGARSTRSEHDAVKLALWQGEVLWGKMVYDTLRAVDYLHTRSDVDVSRIATMGISMGATMSWWLSALEPRIRAAAHLCGLIDFHSLIARADFIQHNFYFYVPNLLKHFSTTDIVAMIAPRPHLAWVGADDRKTPVEGVQAIDTALQAHYRELGAAGGWQCHITPGGHAETEAMRAAVLDFLRENLRPT